MISFDEVMERIKDILAEEIGDRKVFDKDVAVALGIAPASYATMKRRGRLPYEELLTFCSLKRVSINWVLFNQNPSSLVETTNRYQYVRYFPEVHVSAGGGAVNFDEGFEPLAIEDQLLSRLPNVTGNLEALNVVGDSMEPTIHDGSIVFIDRNRTDTHKGGVYAVMTNSGLFIKRIQLRIDGDIDIISDNQDYPPQQVSVEEVRIIGKVIGQFGQVN